MSSFSKKFNTQLLDKVSRSLKESSDLNTEKPLKIISSKKPSRSVSIVPKLGQEKSLLNDLDTWLEESLSIDQKIEVEKPLPPPIHTEDLSPRAKSFLTQVDNIVTKEIKKDLVIDDKTSLKKTPILEHDGLWMGKAFDYIRKTKNDKMKKTLSS